METDEAESGSRPMTRAPGQDNQIFFGALAVAGGNDHLMSARAQFGGNPLADESAAAENNNPHRAQLTLAPGAASGASSKITRASPSSREEAASAIPSETPKRILRGFRFARKITFRPVKSAA